MNLDEKEPGPGKLVTYVILLHVTNVSRVADFFRRRKPEKFSVFLEPACTGIWNTLLFETAKFHIIVLNGLLAGRTTCTVGEQTGLTNSIEFWIRELDRGQFSYFFY